MSRSAIYTIYALTVIFMVVFFVFPILVSVKSAFIGPEGNFTFSYLLEIVDNPLYREGLVNSLIMAVGSTALSLLIAFPLSMLASRYEFPGKLLLTSALLVPLILPPFVGAIGISAMLRPYGAIMTLLGDLGLVSKLNPPDLLGSGSLFGVILMNSLHLYPIFFLNITAALANLDPAMEESAANLGCPPWRRFLRVTLPLAMPGIFAGGVIVFIWAFTELGVPLMFQFSRVTSVQIFDGIKDLGGNPIPYALVVVTFLVSVGTFLISKKIIGSTDYASSGRAATASQLRPLHGAAAMACSAVFLFVVGIAVLPHIGVVATAFSNDWYRTVFPTQLTTSNLSDALGHPITLPSIRNSLIYASLATVVDVVLGVAIAFIVTRTKVAGRNFLDAMSMLPLAVPGLVMAFGYFSVTREGQPLHFLMIGKHEAPIILLIVAYSMRRLPYIVRSAIAGFQQTSVSLEEAAMNLGASPMRTMKLITLPLIAANLVAGGLLAFSFAMMEVSDSLILAQRPEDYPITKAMYILSGNLGNGAALASALGTWSMLFLGVTLIGASMILGKKMGSLFRA